jgi:hypothetical protein
LTTELTAVGAQTANGINDFSQLSIAGRSIPPSPPYWTIRSCLNEETLEHSISASNFTPDVASS